MTASHSGWFSLCVPLKQTSRVVLWENFAFMFNFPSWKATCCQFSELAILTIPGTLTGFYLFKVILHEDCLAYLLNSPVFYSPSD